METARVGVFSQLFNKPSDQARIRAEAVAIMEAERDEIGAGAGIAACGKADVFAFEFGRGGHEPPF